MPEPLHELATPALNSVLILDKRIDALQRELASKPAAKVPRPP